MTMTIIVIVIPVMRLVMGSRSPHFELIVLMDLHPSNSQLYRKGPLTFLEEHFHPFVPSFRLGVSTSHKMSTSSKGLVFVPTPDWTGCESPLEADD